MNKNIYEEIGERIKNARLKKGLNIKQAAKLANIGINTYSTIEVGLHDSRISTYAAIAKALDIGLDYIYFGKENSVNVDTMFDEFKKLNLTDRVYLFRLFTKFDALSKEDKDLLLNIIDSIIYYRKESKK